MLLDSVDGKTGKHLPYWINSEISDDVLQVGDCDKNGDKYKKIQMFCHARYMLPFLIKIHRF